MTTNELADYDTVRVFFDDGSSTVINVHHDDDIQAEVARHCEDNNWDPGSVINWSIED